MRILCYASHLTGELWRGLIKQRFQDIYQYGPESQLRLKAEFESDLHFACMPANWIMMIASKLWALIDNYYATKQFDGLS